MRHVSEPNKFYRSSLVRLQFISYLFWAPVAVIPSRRVNRLLAKYHSKVEEQKVGALWLSSSLFLFYGGIKSIYNLRPSALSLLLFSSVSCFDNLL